MNRSGLWLKGDVMRLTLTFAVMLVIAAGLLFAKTSQSMNNTVTNTVRSTLQPLAQQIQEGYSLGVSPESLTQAERLKSIVAQSKRVSHLTWLDGAANTHLEQTADPLVNGKVLDLPVHSNFGQQLGVLRATYSSIEVDEAQNALLRQFAWLIPVLIATFAVFTTLWLRRHKNSQTQETAKPRHADWLTLGASVVAMTLLAWSSVGQIEQRSQPLVAERVESLLNAQAQLWNKAYALGFSSGDFANQTNWARQLATTQPEVADGWIGAPQGRQDGIVLSTTLISGESLNFKIDPDFFSRFKFSLILDFATLIVIAFFLWRQLPSTTPKAQFAGSAGAERLHLCLFTYFLSEELIRPILPKLASDMPAIWFDSLTQGHWASSMAISTFMVIVAIAQPLLSGIQQTTKAQQVLKLGLTVAAAGQLAAALVSHAELFLLARAMCGAGYAMVFVSGQNLLVLSFGPGKRASAFASLVTAIMAATVVGPALGGLIADNIGLKVSLVLASLVPIVSLTMTLRLPKAAPLTLTADTPPTQNASAFSGLSNPKLMALCFFAAAPAKILLTGLLFFLLPLMATSEQGVDASNTGRVLLVYGLLMLVLAPYFAQSLEKPKLSSTRARYFIVVGLVVSSLCAVPLALNQGFAWGMSWLLVGFSIALALGIGQSISITAQASMVQLIYRASGRQGQEFGWLGTYRLIERLGNAAGPLIASAALLWMTVNQVVVMFSVLALVCAVMLALMLRGLRVEEAQ